MYLFDIITPILWFVFFSLCASELRTTLKNRKNQKKWKTADENGYYPLVALDRFIVGQQRIPRWPNVCSDCQANLGNPLYYSSNPNTPHCENRYHLKRVAYEAAWGYKMAEDNNWWNPSQFDF